jgi:glutathione S-transferase
MAAELTLYTNPMSRGQIARWMIEETGQPYETVLLEYGTTMKAPEYLAINPMGKVPAIRHGDHVVTEGAAICAYLADAFPDAGLAPTADERADYHRWMYFAAGPVEAAITNRYMKWEPTPEQQLMAGYGSYDQVVDVLEGWMAGREYVCGNRFTAADVYFGSQIIWGTMFGTLPPRDAFTPYVERLTAREAYKSAKAKDNALMPKKD